METRKNNEYLKEKMIDMINSYEGTGVNLFKKMISINFTTFGIVYMPDQGILYRFVEKMISVFTQGNLKFKVILVVEDGLLSTKVSVYKRLLEGVGFFKDLLHFRNKDVILINHTEFVDFVKEIRDPSSLNTLFGDNSALVFDDARSISNFMDVSEKCKSFIDAFDFKIGFTSSPFFFYDLRTSSQTICELYAPMVSEDNDLFFQEFLSNSEVVWYDRIEDEIHNVDNFSKNQVNGKILRLCKYIDDLKSGNICFGNQIGEIKAFGDRFMHLLCNGIYDTEFITKVILKDNQFKQIKDELCIANHVSDKLKKLENILRSVDEKEICILFETRDILDIVCSTLRFRFQNVELKIIDGGYLLKWNAKEDKITIKNLHFLLFENAETKKELIKHFIFFDFIPMNVGVTKTVMYHKNQKDFFNRILSLEHKIKVEFNNTVDESILPCKKKLIDVSHTYRLKLHTDTEKFQQCIQMIKKYCNFDILDVDESKKLLFIDKKFNFSFLGTMVSIRTHLASEVENIKYLKDFLSITAEDLVLGTMSSFNTFSDPYLVNSSCYVFFRRDSILIYSSSSARNFRIRIKNNILDDYIFVDKNDSGLDIYFSLNTKPDVYVSEDLNNILRRKEGFNDLKTNPKYRLFESASWKRCSLDEVEFINNRHDIKIKVNLKKGTVRKRLSEIMDLHENKKNLLSNLEEGSNYSEVGKNRSKNVTKQDVSIGKAIQNEEYKFYDYVDALVSTLRMYKNTKIIFSRVDDKSNNKLGYSEIMNSFKNSDFDDYYYILSLMSQKGRYIVYNVDDHDIEEIKKKNVRDFAIYLFSFLNKRFQNIKDLISNFKPREKNYVDNVNRVRQVIVTPLNIIYKISEKCESNRVLRFFDNDKFIRVSLREENGSNRIKDDFQVCQDNIFEFYRKILYEGLFIGERKYFFLAMTTSQMRMHNAWFITPYFSKNILIGPDYIRNWLGDFSKIKNIGKYAIRLGQALSSTIATIEVENFLEVNDVERNNFIFSDGIGLVSFSYAKEIAVKLGLKDIPSAFQIRFAGFKGVIVTHPLVDEDKSILQEYNISEKKIVSLRKLLSTTLECNFKENDENSKEENMICDTSSVAIKKVKTSNLAGYNLILRKSMKKFDSLHRCIDVLRFSTCNPSYLNKQVIMLLEGLGIDKSIFLEHFNSYIIKLLYEINTNPIGYVKKFFNIVTNSPYLHNSKIIQKLIVQIFKKNIKDIYKKNKILVENGCSVMGTLDEIRVLKENEIFLKIKKGFVKTKKQFIDDGDHIIVVGKVLVVKNPCLHPGDIRTVKAVYKEELRYLKDIVVFNQMGDRPLPNMCSGSDLDGDVYTIIWDDTLIPSKTYPPAEYETQTYLYKERVGLKDIVNFYIRYIRNFHLGNIAHSHLVYSDEHDVKSEGSLLLANLFNKSIDFPKTGFMASVPEPLLPQRYPDFMETKLNTYQSFKILGILYRRAYQLLLDSSLKCDCKVCVEKQISKLPILMRKILEGSDIKYKKLIWIKEPTEEHKKIFNSFKIELNAMLNKLGHKKEEDMCLNFNDDDCLNTNSENTIRDYRNLLVKYKNIIKSKNLDISGFLSLSEGCLETCNSLSLSILENVNLSNYVVYRNVFENKNTSNFIYNSMVNIVTVENDIIMNTKSMSSDSRCVTDVLCDRVIWEGFNNRIYRTHDKLFKEIFDILYAVEFFSPNFFELVCLFFCYVQTKLKKSDKIELTRVLFEISKDLYRKPIIKPMIYFILHEIERRKKSYSSQKIEIRKLKSENVKDTYESNSQEIKEIIDRVGRVISSIGVLISFDVNLTIKINTLKYWKKEFVFSNVTKQISKKNTKRVFGLIIKGMLDGSDELRLEEYKGLDDNLRFKSKSYVPRLLNRGTCDMSNHKDQLKDFFIDMFYSQIANKVTSSKNSKLRISISVIPGKLLLYNVPNIFLNKIVTVEKLSAGMQISTTNASFICSLINSCDILDMNKRESYIKNKNIVFSEKENFFTLNLQVKNIRYQVHLEFFDNKFRIKQVAKGRSLLGKIFITNDSVKEDEGDKDVSFECVSEEIIYDENICNFNPLEHEIFKGELIRYDNETFVLANIHPDVLNCSFTLDCKLSVHKKCSFNLCNKQLYKQSSSKDKFTLFKNKVVVSVDVMNEGMEIKELRHFLELFERAWDGFIFYLS